MGKLLFIPFSIAGGIVAGLLSKKLFGLAWGLVDEEEPPEPEHREVTWPKLALAHPEHARDRLPVGEVAHPFAPPYVAVFCARAVLRRLPDDGLLGE